MITIIVQEGKKGQAMRGGVGRSLVIMMMIMCGGLEGEALCHSERRWKECTYLEFVYAALHFS